MALTPVKSSNIEAVDYDPVSRHLVMHFLGGKKGIHKNITPKQYDALIGDGSPGHSVGKHYHAHIRGREAHPYTRIDE